jgi:hypothetical protein
MGLRITSEMLFTVIALATVILIAGWEVYFQ